jgi:hypothetical protein
MAQQLQAKKAQRKAAKAGQTKRLRPDQASCNLLLEPLDHISSAARDSTMAAWQQDEKEALKKAEDEEEEEEEEEEDEAEEAAGIEQLVCASRKPPAWDTWHGAHGVGHMACGT